MGKITKASMLFSAAALFAAASPAAAVPGGPPIAYAVNSGKTIDVYLSNADGSGKVKVYSTTSKNNLWQIDVRPGGNQLALVENVSPPSIDGTIKIINYSDAGVVGTTTVVSPAGCHVLGVDYHPTDGSLLVSRYCNPTYSIIEVRRLVNGTYDSTPIITLNNSDGNTAAGYVRWMGDGSGFLWAIATNPGGGTIERHSLSNPYAPVTVYLTGDFALPTWFDVARCAGAILDSSCSKMLVTTRSGDLQTASFEGTGSTPVVIHSPNATDGHYSPDNSQVLWRYQTHSGYRLMIDDSVFLSKGGTGVKDWRQ
jgi:hypothetical protein